ADALDARLGVGARRGHPDRRHAEQREEDAEHHREEARPHAGRRAELVRGGEDGEGAPEDEKQDSRPEIAMVADAHAPTPSSRPSVLHYGFRTQIRISAHSTLTGAAHDNPSRLRSRPSSGRAVRDPTYRIRHSKAIPSPANAAATPNVAA